MIGNRLRVLVFYYSNIPNTFVDIKLFEVVQYQVETLTYLTLSWAWTAKAVKLDTSIVWVEVWLSCVDFSLQNTSAFSGIFQGDFLGCIAGNFACLKHRSNQDKDRRQVAFRKDRETWAGLSSVCGLCLPGECTVCSARGGRDRVTSCLQHPGT